MEYLQLSVLLGIQIQNKCMFYLNFTEILHIQIKAKNKLSWFPNIQEGDIL